MDHNIPTKLIWNEELIQNFWDGVEQTRMKELNFSLLAGDYFLELIGTELCKSKQYLDFGSGSGEIICSLVKKGFQVAAYDISGNRLKSLKQNKNILNNDLFLGQVTKESNQQFDTIFMTEVIEHIIPNNLDSIIAIIKSKLKPGGTIIITTPNKEEIELGICYCPTCNHTFHRWQHLISFSSKSLIDVMNNSGFIKKNLHLVDFSMNRIVFEENKRLKKQVEQLKSKDYINESEFSFSQNKEKLDIKLPDLRIGAETHILYIGQLSN